MCLEFAFLYRNNWIMEVGSCMGGGTGKDGWAELATMEVWDVGNCGYKVESKVGRVEKLLGVV